MTTLLARASAALAAVVAAALGGAALQAAPTAQAAPAGDNVIINEVYGAGGSAGQPYTNKFVELYNPTSAPISLDGWSVQYRSASGTSAANGVVALSGTIAPNGYYLVQGGSNGANGTALPAPDASGALNTSGTNGVVFLATSPSAINPGTGSVVANPQVVDLVGYGTPNTYETAAAQAPTSNGDPRSLQRTGFADTNSNLADFSLAAPTPMNSAAAGTPGPTTTPEPTGTPTPTPTPTPAPTATPIAQIQGTGDASPFVGQTVATEGVVTAAYPTGGLAGFVIQTPGAVDPATQTASTGLFVYAPQLASTVKIGDSVQVAGAVSEYYGQTQITATTVTPIASLGTVAPAAISWPATDAGREVFESMLVLPTDKLVVTDNYGLNQYGEIGLSVNAPLVTPTEVGAPMSPEAQAQAADNAARGVLLDDGQTLNYFTNATGKNTPLPYLDADRPVTVGATATFAQPVVLAYGYSKWRLQPTVPVSGLNPQDEPASFGDVREDAPDFGGADELTIATFNVLNYFTDLGKDHCTASQSYKDREGNPITANGCLPRGAWDEANFERQQAKIVAAINTMDADVVSLEEIEDSTDFGKPRDTSLAQLVTALNQAAGGEKWAYVPSPAVVPGTGNDVIRTAFIYQPASVAPHGEASILDDPAFQNARAPHAMTFSDLASGELFNVIVNHFKSKGGSGTGDNENLDTVNGPAGAVGGWNGDRTRQAEALLRFAGQIEGASGTNVTFLAGDFNAYSQESPVTTITGAGYTDLGHSTSSTTGLTEYSYLFGGALGSLDHVFASPAAMEFVTGHDIWTINSYESVAYEYSRWNYNVESFYSPDVYRSSDHNPEVVRIQFATETTPEPVERKRFAGADRYETAVQVSLEYGIVGNPVILATGQSYADALAAGPMAAKLDASLLLTPHGALPASVSAEIARLQPSVIYIIGSTDSVSDSVATAAAAYGNTRVERIAGTDRVETSVKIADRFFTAADGAFVATGWNFPDALSASSAGALTERPVLLTPAGSLDDRVEQYLKATPVTQVVLVGGEPSLSATVLAEAQAAAPAAEVTRLHGDSRYSTNIEANREFPGTDVDAIAVATGRNFPDALVASVVVDREQAPLVLSPGGCAVPDTAAYLAEIGEVSTYTLGDTNAVQDGWSGTACP